MTEIITDTQSLRQLVDELKAEPFVTVDTEFMREKTYWPKLCLVQLAGASRAAAVDPLAEGIDLAPLGELLADPSVLKVFHAARQDVEIFLLLFGAVPTPMFDTQVAAMVCGFGESVGYETLVNKLARASIDKSSRFTDWSRRPLTEKQATYALADVTHLRTVYEKLARLLEDSGREEWLDEEMATLNAAETYETKPDVAWERIRTRSLDRRFLGLVRELGAWRERQAQSRNVPRTFITKDETLLEMASSQPKTLDDLKRVRGLPKWAAEGAGGEEVLSCIARALVEPKGDLPDREPPRDLPRGLGPLIELLKVLLKMKSEEHGVARTLIASQDDLETLAIDGPTAPIAALKGWRHEVFGEDALRLLSGEVALGARGRSIAVLSLSGEEAVLQSTRRKRRKRKLRKDGDTTDAGDGPADGTDDAGTISADIAAD
ncbi:ribonuclease D [Tistrella bauzanensis]|uniref:ribonuclease D n=1 Tax=Tistrella TaxID=171436 RepID=UPI0031F68397